jgi:hypothetical protein
LCLCVRRVWEMVRHWVLWRRHADMTCTQSTANVTDCAQA